MGRQSLLLDLVRAWTQSHSFHTKHFELRCLSVQHMTNSGTVKVRDVSGELNLADHPKGKTWHEIEKLIRGVGGKMTIGRSDGQAASNPRSRTEMW